MTPRHRIAVQREIAGGNADPSVLNKYLYDGIDTCATDGLCEMACPVNIDTGSYVKSLRQGSVSRIGKWVSIWSAKHFASTQFMVRSMLGIGKSLESILGSTIWASIFGLLNKIGFPYHWNDKIPRVANNFSIYNGIDREAWVYFPTCLSRVFAGNDQNASIVDTLVDISKKVGISLEIPPGINAYCCGQPYSSKGYDTAAAISQEKPLIYCGNHRSTVKSLF